MTIQLELNKTYRTRDGSSEHTIDRITTDPSPYGDVAHAGHHAWWAKTGKALGDEIRPDDLVEEVTTGPVRQVTTTRTEIVPGTYGRVWVDLPAHGDNGVNPDDIWAAIVPRGPSTHKIVMCALNAEELDATAATLTQLAAALRQIAAEQNT